MNIQATRQDNMKNADSPTVSGVTAQSFVISWVHLFKGTKGVGTRELTKEAAENLAAELNESYPDITHTVIEKGA